jgi:Domain of unknown function (DUF4190)
VSNESEQDPTLEPQVPPVPPVPPPPQQHVSQVVYVQQPKTNGLAVASLVLGIIWIYWIGSILALIFGYNAKGQIDRSNGMQGGRGLAVAGIVLGWVGVGTLAIVLIAALIAAGSE